MKFRTALLAAVEAAYSAGDISLQDARRIRLASAFPRLCRALESAIHETATAETAVESLATIDWAKLLDFIKQLIPLILELIKLFK